MEAIPADDMGLQRAISLYYVDGSKSVRCISNWRKWKGLAGLYLITTEIMG